MIHPCERKKSTSIACLWNDKMYLALVVLFAFQDVYVKLTDKQTNVSHLLLCIIFLCKRFRNNWKWCAKLPISFTNRNIHYNFDIFSIVHFIISTVYIYTQHHHIYSPSSSSSYQSFNSVSLAIVHVCVKWNRTCMIDNIHKLHDPFVHFCIQDCFCCFFLLLNVVDLFLSLFVNCIIQHNPHIRFLFTLNSLSICICTPFHQLSVIYKENIYNFACLFICLFVCFFLLLPNSSNCWMFNLTLLF